MAFEVFDRSTDKILRMDKKRLLIDLDQSRVRLTKGAVEALKLTKGDHIRFLREHGQWFLTRGNKTTGYLLTTEGARAGLRANCIQPARTIMQNLKPNKLKWEFQLKDTGRDFEGNPIYQLMPVLA